MVELQYFGHSFFRVGEKGFNILFDPIFETTKTEQKLQRAIPIKKSQLKDISLILLGNETPEHFDSVAVQEIALRNNATVVGHEVVLNQLILPRHQKLAIGSNSELFIKGVKIKSIIAHYPKSFYPMGYLVEINGKKIYHAGVTSLLDTFAQIDADVALLPIGGDSAMDVVDAVRATKMMKPLHVIPMQYNTFGVSKSDPKDFKSRIEKSLLRTNPVILSPGQKFKL
jgi:L-ascorbate metabolism protein UlaG (beta-lactamase superfamily)